MKRLITCVTLTLCLLHPLGAVARGEGDSSPDPAVAATSDPLDRYSSAAIWNWYAAGLLDRDFSSCGAATVFALDPERDPRQVGCIAEAMLDLGASAEAERFFEQTHQFLVEIQPEGPRVDLGRASVPWQNMGRGQSVFLNGLPRAMPLYALEETVFAGWQQAAGYPALLARFPRAFPWTEYSRLARNEPLTDGAQRVVLEFSMRECRACPEVAWMPVSFTFDTQGALVQTEVRPPTGA
jgi:hypothetical protein